MACIRGILSLTCQSPSSSIRRFSGLVDDTWCHSSISFQGPLILKRASSMLLLSPPHTLIEASSYTFISNILHKMLFQNANNSLLNVSFCSFLSPQTIEIWPCCPNFIHIIGPFLLCFGTLDSVDSLLLLTICILLFFFSASCLVSVCTRTLPTVLF